MAAFTTILALAAAAFHVATARGAPRCSSPVPLLVRLTTSEAVADVEKRAVTVVAGPPCWTRRNESEARRARSGRLAGCAFGGGVALRAPLPPALLEASGVAASGEFPGRIYTHNDGGADGGTLYALDATNRSGAALAVYKLRGGGDDGVTSDGSDWEDVAVAREPLAPRRWKVYVGDIGNNGGRRRVVRVLRFDEPPPPVALPVSLPSSEVPGAVPHVFIDGFDTLRLEYPKSARDDVGRYPDAETLIVDPTRGDIFLVAKERDPGKREAKETAPGARVYRARYPYSAQRKNRLTYVGRLGFSGQIVGGDVSRDGEELLLKTPGEVLHVRCGDLSVSPQPYVREVQGEAIGFATDGSGYYTVSERSVKKNGKSKRMAPAVDGGVIFHPRMA